MTHNERNRAYQRRWYAKQKNIGIVYLITFSDGDTYVGSTTNSLVKRLAQHRSCPPTSTKHKNYDGASIKEIQKGSRRTSLRELEQEWICKLLPTLNLANAVPVPKQKGCYKGGVEYCDVWYPTKKRLWELLGNCNYNTFKRRLHLGKSLEDALK